MAWPDMLDPLGGLEDPLGDDSLDAFVNLDTLLMGNTFFEDCDLTPVDPEPVEVKPVIEFQPEPAPKVGKATGKSNNRKRKADKSAITNTEGVKTSVFEIPAADHDYSSKLQKLCTPEERVSTQISASKTTEDKQAVRRMKNNVASKRSREQRKAKFEEMDKEAEFLTEENERLRQKIIEMEQTAKEMKALLVAKMAGKA